MLPVKAKRRGPDEPSQEEPPQPSRYKPSEHADQRSSRTPTSSLKDPNSHMAVDNLAPYMDAYSMPDFGVDTEFSTGLQWDQIEMLFPAGQLPMFDPAWDKYLIGGAGMIGITGALPVEFDDDLQTGLSFSTSGLTGQLPDNQGVTLADYHGGLVPEFNSPLLDHSS